MLDARSLDEVARLHAQCLPDSIVVALGGAYVKSFYRFMSRSDQELLVIQRRDDGAAIAVAVVSLTPATLPRRLLFGTSLIPSAIRRLPRLIAAALAPRRDHARSHERGGASIPARRPQLILIFTAVAERGKGHGTALLREIEGRLRDRGITEYEVRTEARPSNPALAFYRDRGFVPDGLSMRFGTSFQVLRRPLGDR
jgi:GNAT superfamily N-acetyltransferase